MYESFFGMEHTRLYEMSRRKNYTNPMHSVKHLDGCLMWQTVRCLPL